MITNKELWEEFYQQIKDSENISEIVKEYGGSSVYVPSYKSTYRNDDIIEEFENGSSIKELAKKHDLSETSIYAITKELRLG